MNGISARALLRSRRDELGVVREVLARELGQAGAGVAEPALPLEAVLDDHAPRRRASEARQGRDGPVEQRLELGLVERSVALLREHRLEALHEGDERPPPSARA